jgi:hypothetical protein
MTGRPASGGRHLTVGLPASQTILAHLLPGHRQEGAPAHASAAALGGRNGFWERLRLTDPEHPFPVALHAVDLLLSHQLLRELEDLPARLDARGLLDVSVGGRLGRDGTKIGENELSVGHGDVGLLPSGATDAAPVKSGTGLACASLRRVDPAASRLSPIDHCLGKATAGQPQTVR